MAHVPRENTNPSSNLTEEKGRERKHTEAPVELESHSSHAAGCKVNQATDDIPRTVCDLAVFTLSRNLWCVDSRQMEFHTRGCQECQVAAMWWCIFFAALTSVQTPEIRGYFRPAGKRSIDEELPRFEIEGLTYHGDAVEKLFMLTGRCKHASMFWRDVWSEKKSQKKPDKGLTGVHLQTSHSYTKSLVAL